MLENPSPAAAASLNSAAVATSVKRYAPPNQRNRSLNRRKTGDRFDRSSHLYANDREKNQQNATSRNIHAVDHGDLGSNNILNEKYRQRLILLQGCCCSEASQLLIDRWAEVMHKYNDTSTDLSEKPVMYSGSSALAWGTSRQHHQMMSPANSIAPSGSQTDFLSELRRAIHKAGANYK